MQKNKKLIFFAVFLACFLMLVFLGQEPPKKQVPSNTEPLAESRPNQRLPKPEPKDEFPENSTYVGSWRTDRYRKLDGIMTCNVHYLGNHKWEGKFHGNWHGVNYSYDVQWSGSHDKLEGSASINGVDYKWTGRISGTEFVGEFDSRRYVGDFSLKRRQ